MSKKELPEEDHSVNYPLYYQDLKPIKEQFVKIDKSQLSLVLIVEELQKRVEALEKESRLRSDKEVMENL